MPRPVNIIIAGGKTGGHLFPGIATAQALTDLPRPVEIFFVGTDTPFEKKTLKAHGFRHRAITASGIKGKGIGQKLMAVTRIPLSVMQSFAIITEIKPDLVLGVGGYASGPVLLAAALCGIPTAIQEQNAVPGMTNRILSRFVNKIFISFSETKGFSSRTNAVLTGNPIRRVIPAPPAEEGLPPGTKNQFILLVTGGSQGAASINRTVPHAMDRLKEKNTVHVIHQTGTKDASRVATHYDQKGISATVRPFFHDMPRLQKRADLIICRAGAGTLSELTALGKPSILVPYPHAADDHQRYNAKALEKKGAAKMIADQDLTPASLAAAVDDCRFTSEKLQNMARAAHRLGMPRASETVARELITLISKQR